MLTVQILTKNNEATIVNTLESVKNYNILIGDLGSTDSTLSICKQYTNKIFNFNYKDLSVCRNELIEKSNTEWQLWLEPDEILTGELEFKENYYKLFIIQNKLITKSIRLWNKKCGLKFIQPVFEYLDVRNAPILDVFIEKNNINYSLKEELIKHWISEHPFYSKPYYYQSYINLINKDYNDFLRNSSQFFFKQNIVNLPFIMLKYYASMVLCYEKRDINESLSALLYCLAENPLMAEFWCLAGDIFFHLAKDYKKAIYFYENAIILGKNRNIQDDFPIDLDKYDEYPKSMIAACLNPG